MTSNTAKKVTITRIFDAPVDLVWQAITRDDLVKQWAPIFGVFKGEVGFETHFLGGPDEAHQYLHHCRVLEVVEGKRLSYTWSYDKIEGNSVVTFELTAIGEKTRMDFTHEFVKPFPPDDPNLAIGNFEIGWTYMIGELQKLVELP